MSGTITTILGQLQQQKGLRVVPAQVPADVHVRPPLQPRGGEQRGRVRQELPGEEDRLPAALRAKGTGGRGLCLGKKHIGHFSRPVTIIQV